MHKACGVYRDYYGSIIETTLAGGNGIRLIQDAKAYKFEITMFYVFDIIDYSDDAGRSIPSVFIFVPLLYLKTGIRA